MPLPDKDSLKSRSRRITASEAVIDTFVGIQGAIDVRTVYDDNDLLEGIVPLVVVRLVMKGREKEQEIVFQLDKFKLDELAKMLDKQRTKLLEVSKRIQMIPTPE